MFSRLAKFRRTGEEYEDLDRVEMDITEPAMRRYAGIGEGEAPSSEQAAQEDVRKEPKEETFTIQQAIDNIGFGKFQMADAMEMMILSILSPALHCDWQINEWKQAFITTIVFCGMMCSSGIWGVICDKYGRRSELILCSVFTCYFGFLSAFAPTFIWLLILRGLVGFGIGGAPQSVTLYSEFLPTASRATCVILVEIFWAIGACFEVLLALAVMPTLGWRWLLGLSAVPLLIFSCCCAASKRGSVRDLFIPELKKTTLILWVIWLVSAFAYYGIVLMTTELFESPDGCHGTTKNKSPSDPSCYVHCKSLTRDDYVDLTWTTLAEFPGLFLTVFIIERIGRKMTMAVEFFFFAVFVLLANICTTRPVLTFFLFVARALISGAFQAAYVYTPEVYPTSMRAIGLGSCSGMARVGAIVTPFVAQDHSHDHEVRIQPVKTTKPS
ncbi:SVOP-like protein [Mya arenaria]|uniref:SVOP-like protein n=1 Tax=Mya arenaria TaxID=6604 RepID=A0ABY7E2N0_MYAAR|nr:SVOP-like protein [Mya arenaria]